MLLVRESRNTFELLIYSLTVGMKFKFMTTLMVLYSIQQLNPINWSFFLVRLVIIICLVSFMHSIEK
ncbi:hypothetical protein JM66_00115 [Aeromonas bestiarum]|nr:hypothetical protein JM66_00115 [Aeromonas bestiarum]